MTEFNFDQCFICKMTNSLGMKDNGFLETGKELGTIVDRKCGGAVAWTSAKIFTADANLRKSRKMFRIVANISEIVLACSIVVITAHMFTTATLGALVRGAICIFIEYEMLQFMHGIYHVYEEKFSSQLGDALDVVRVSSTATEPNEEEAKGKIIDVYVKKLRIIFQYTVLTKYIVPTCAEKFLRTQNISFLRNNIAPI